MLTIIVSVVLFCITTQAIADSERKYITVTGKGKISAIPDIAWVSSGVSTHAKTASEALTKNSNLMQAVIQVLRNANIKDKNIQTSGF